MGSIPKEPGLIRSRLYYVIQLRTAYSGDQWTCYNHPGGDPVAFPYKPDAQDAGRDLVKDNDWVFKARVAKVWEKWYLVEDYEEADEAASQGADNS